MRIFRKLLLLLFFFLPSALAEPQFEVHLDRAKVNTSEIATFSIQAKWPKAEAKYQFAFPPLNLLENLTLVQQGEAQESFSGEGGEWVRKTFSFQLQGKKAGQAKIPSFEVSYVDAQTQSVGRYAVPTQTLKITKKFNVRNGIIISIIIAAAAEIFILLAAAAKKKKIKQLAAESEPTPASNLENFRKFMENNSFLTTQFKDELAGHLKTFLQESYGIAQTGKNIQSVEVVRGLEAKGLGREEIYEVKTVLKAWEEINYAGRVNDAEFREFRSQLIRLIQNKRA